jgi:hypothetical protein
MFVPLHAAALLVSYRCVQSIDSLHVFAVDLFMVVPPCFPKVPVPGLHAVGGLGEFLHWNRSFNSMQQRFCLGICCKEA